MRLTTLLLFSLLPCLLHADEPADRVVVHLLDPRGAISGETTFPTEWNDGKAELLGTRRLSTSEANILRELLRTELTENDNVPFCGHHPAYAVVTTPNRRSSSSVTLCGTCWTWAEGGERRVLGGKKAIEYLGTLLPLPSVFRGDDGEPLSNSPFDDHDERPFHLMD